MKLLPTLFLAPLFPAAGLADLTQTFTLTPSNLSNLNLDTGTAVSFGGDTQFSSAGIAPLGSATLLNMGYESSAAFADISPLLVELYPGNSAAAISLATLTAARARGRLLRVVPPPEVRVAGSHLSPQLEAARVAAARNTSQVVQSLDALEATLNTRRLSRQVAAHRCSAAVILLTVIAPVFNVAERG